MSGRVLGAVLVASAACVVVLGAQSSSPPAVTALALSGANLTELRQWDARITASERSGSLVLRTTRVDTILQDRQHDRFDQYVSGVRVFGGDVVRQTRSGVTESIFGSLHEQIALDLVPRLSVDDATSRLGALAKGELQAEFAPELVILPLDDGGYALTWREHVWTDEGWMHTFVDASSGAVLLHYNDLQTQVAIGTGTGVLGDRKKISASPLSGRYVADDKARPPLLITYDARGNLSRAVSWLNGAMPTANDIAGDDDNVWTDVANVDAHVYLGWTYDYLYRRFGRRGFDDRDVPVRAITHPLRRQDVFSVHILDVLRFGTNASWWPGAGPGRTGIMLFGDGLPSGVTLGGRSWNYLAGALDVVSHELTHGLIDYSSKLTYRNESGALNEAFADIIGTSVEFYYASSGASPRSPDYLIGEDVTPGGIRSMANPRAFGDPDHYSIRARGSQDNGGVHTNSGIPNHAFYLAIEGGMNRTSGLHVTGVGPVNREQIEKAFFRAFIHLLPSNATFNTARIATILSARELYGVGSPAERAITEAWTAAGVH